jgi:nucleoside 2-deoxyribosyltransferase
MRDGKPEIYLAGPEVFLPDALACATALKEKCQRLGAIGWFPLDNQHDVADPDPDIMAANISRADEALIRRCDALVANMVPHRGPSMDAGTCYEMGFARALGKIVVGYTTDWRRFAEKVAATTTFDGEWLHDANGMRYRDFGLIDNLMMVKGAAAVLGSFEAAVDYVVRHFASQVQIDRKQ